MLGAGLGELLFVCWLSMHELGRRAAKPVFGSQEVGGAPRWRSLVGMGTSLGALPLLLAAAVLHAGSYSAWVEVAGELRPYDRAFCYIFGGLMLVDFLQQTMHTTLLKVHHATCLAGHLWTIFLAPAGFASYFTGVVALEVGSAGTCAHALWPHRFTPMLLLCVMTLSNLTAAAAVWVFQYHAAVAAPVGRWVAGLISLALIGARQMDAQGIWRESRRSTAKSL